ncbi:MAG: hypothetical protein ACOC8E_08095 [Planctomycetota bacterium]
MIRPRSWSGAVLTVILMFAAFAESPAGEPADAPNPKVEPPRRGGFTGPKVPSLTPLLGDYVNVGVRTADGRTDIPFAPHLSFLVVCYFGYQKSIDRHVRAGAIDGVIFPYFYPHRNHSNTNRLLPQIKTCRSWLDARTQNGRRHARMPLVLMIYATNHSQSPDAPTPRYVGKCIRIGRDATEKGLTGGVVTYCLPKDKPKFVKAVART